MKILTMSEELFETHLERYEDMVQEILQILHGDKNLGLVGINQKITDVQQSVQIKINEMNIKLLALEAKLVLIEQGSSRWKYIVWAFSAGVIFTLAIVFGLTLKEIKAFVK